MATTIRGRIRPLPIRVMGLGSGRFLRDFRPRWSCGQAEPVVVVPVVRLVPVAVRRPAVPAVVVPAAAAEHPSRGLGRHPDSLYGSTLRATTGRDHERDRFDATQPLSCWNPGARCKIYT